LGKSLGKSHSRNTDIALDLQKTKVSALTHTASKKKKKKHLIKRPRKKKEWLSNSKTGWTSHSLTQGTIFVGKPARGKGANR